MNKKPDDKRSESSVNKKEDQKQIKLGVFEEEDFFEEFEDGIFPIKHNLHL